jgi:hypothetical protein
VGQGQLRQLQYPVEIHGVAKQSSQPVFFVGGGEGHGVELLEDVLKVEGKGSLAWLLRNANAVQLDREWLGQHSARFADQPRPGRVSAGVVHLSRLGSSNNL